MPLWKTKGTPCVSDFAWAWGKLRIYNFKLVKIGRVDDEGEKEGGGIFNTYRVKGASTKQTPKTPRTPGSAIKTLSQGRSRAQAGGAAPQPRRCGFLPIRERPRRRVRRAARGFSELFVKGRWRGRGGRQAPPALRRAGAGRMELRGLARANGRRDPT